MNPTPPSGRTAQFRARRGCMHLVAASLLGAPLSVAPLQVFAQAWPARPIKVVVNFPPGGAADQLARAVSQPLQDALGQPVVVENKTGAGGNLGAESVAKAPADGYTLLMTYSGVASINPLIFQKMSFDPMKELVPVAAVIRSTSFLVARESLPVGNAREFFAYLKQNSGKVTYASQGSGSGAHLSTEMMNAQLGVKAAHVPYRGAAPAINDLLAGQVDFAFDPGVAIPHIQSGKLKLIAIGSGRRSPLFPDVPTLGESGLAGFDAGGIFGFFAPAGTSPQVVARLNQEINTALGMPAIARRIETIGATSAAMTAPQFADYIAEERNRYVKIVRELNIVAD